MNFNTMYHSPMDRGYHAENTRPSDADIEKPLLSISEMGSTTFEAAGQQDLIMGAQAEIRKGVGKIELATGLGGPTQPVGAESYGKEARQAFREIARVNKIEFTSVHTPTAVNGLSGYNAQQGTFSDEYRRFANDEISKAIRFAAEATEGGGVVVHSSEFDRPVSEESWAKTEVDGKTRYKFLSSFEEPEKAVMRVVDERDGRVMNIARKNQKIERPQYHTAKEDKIFTDRFGVTHNIKKGDFLDIEGRPTLDTFERVPIYDEQAGRFKTEVKTWVDFEEEAKKWNEANPNDPKTPAEVFYKSHAAAEIAQLKGMSIYHSQRYEQYMRNREKLVEQIKLEQARESMLTEEQKKDLLQEYRGMTDINEKMTPVERLTEQLRDIDQHLKSSNQSAAMEEARAKQMQNDLTHIKPIETYALEQSYKTLAQAGIEAFEQTKNNPHVKSDRPVFIAVENWDPNAYGSHPDEMIKIIQNSRDKMVEYMTQSEITDSTGKRIENPFYQSGVGKDEAQKYAEQHIKMTLDTEHLGLWRKKFMPMPGEKRGETNERFNKWYLEQIDKLAESGIVGHVHLVDGIEGSHQHLPAGQGEYPLKDMVKRLKDKGFKGTIVSEGHSENRRWGTDRQVRSAWAHFGNPIYGSSFSGGTGPRMWKDVDSGYFGKAEPPMFIYGAYAPSNDWSLWSQVPLE